MAEERIDQLETELTEVPADAYLVVQTATATAKITGANAGVSPSAPITESGTTRTLADSDHGRSIYCTAATTITVTAPPDLTPGTIVQVWQDGAGQVQIVAGTGVTLHYPATFNPYTAEQNSPLTVQYKTATDVYVSGDLEAA